MATARAATLSGTVRDSEGAVIPNAHVIVRWDSSGSNYLKDNLGKTLPQELIQTDFSVDLPPGFYDVFVAAMAFTPHCDKVRLKGKEVKTYEVKLIIRPVTSKELNWHFVLSGNPCRLSCRIHLCLSTIC